MSKHLALTNLSLPSRSCQVTSALVETDFLLFRRISCWPAICAGPPTFLSSPCIQWIRMIFRPAIPAPCENPDMDHRTAGRYWEGNAHAWTVLIAAGGSMIHIWIFARRRDG